LGPYKKRIAIIGDIVLVSILHINPKKFVKMKLFKRKRFFKGKIHRGLIVRSKTNYLRSNKNYIKFNENSVVLVNKRKIPISNRVYGPVLIEICKKIPALGYISRYII